MANISRKKLPDMHDLVIGVVNKIAKHGVYVKLVEYGDLDGYCHVSEVAGAWIRNIRNYVRIDQQVVCKVLRVKDDQVDVSIKRASDSQKKEAVQEYKRQNAALRIVDLISEKVKISSEDIRDMIEDEFISVFGTLYNGFEEFATVEEEAFVHVNVPEELKQAIVEVSLSSIQLTSISITSTLGVRSFAPNGVENVITFLQSAEDVISQYKDITHEVSTIGSPRYRIYLEGHSYDELSDIYKKIEQKLAEVSKDLDIEYKLERN
ncbi:MAG: S1 RNA-binding domain-containing protein [Candidatus Heimdallarchaeota archaeon]|nr:S1 RNA-binding domain-containing protein [Candidatus Heimdallarchaeota archaeon]MDH5645661.1 S1 RNA-binding domain-containing protein [Candidatus Heimdallarchaeota archaeon]